MYGDETILVVEDADDIRKMVCSMLALQGYTCLAASSGPDAIDLIERRPEPVHLMLTDVVMPKMPGSELARRVSRMRPEIRIVLMSGFSEDPVVRSYQCTPTPFIAKPFTAATLYSTIRQALDQPWHGLPEPFERS